jgi:hypothetical protein
MGSIVLSEQKISRETGSFDGNLLAGDAFGSGVEALGDLDGDGPPDVAVGAPGDDHPPQQRRRVDSVHAQRRRFTRSTTRMADSKARCAGETGSALPSSRSAI